MENFGISTDALPMFLGSECVVEHIKTLRLKNRDIHKDSVYVKSRLNDTTEQRKNDFKNTGWVDISNLLLPLNDLFVFVGIQSFNVPLNLVRFRHHQGKTQARIAFTSEHPMIATSYQNLDSYIEIFIYQRLNNLTPNSGYGIHIYDANSRLKYKDGLNLLTNIRSVPIHFNDLSTETPSLTSLWPYSKESNPQLTNLGINIAVLQTTHCVYTKCYKQGQHWNYFGTIFTSYLTENGTVEMRGCDNFNVYDGKKHAYPSYAKGGEYIDNVVCTDHILVIDKPH